MRRWWPRERPALVKMPIEHFVLTARLRWSRAGVLEQLHKGSQGTERWEPVPMENGEHIDPEKEKRAYEAAKANGFVP